MAEKKSNIKPKEEEKLTGDEAPTKAVSKPKKSKRGLIFGLIAVALIVIIGIVVALLCLNKTDPSDPTAKLTYSEASFIYDDGEYTLWNAEGEQLTEDKYVSQSSFVGGYALVKKDDQYGIIRSDGTMSVDYGKYGNITTKGGLYLAQDGNTRLYFLLTGSGRVLAEGDDLEVYAGNSTSGFAVLKTNEKNKIYDYSGRLVAETEVVEGNESPVTSSSHDFGFFHYNNQNILLDARNGKVIAEFEGPRYSFDSVSDDRKLVLLENYDDTGKYKLFVDGKIYDLDETKYYGITAIDQVVGYDGYSELALLDENYRVSKRVSTYVELKDSNNYAVQSKDDGVEIYYNGEKVKGFGKDSSVAASGVMYENLYAIDDGDKYMFYNLDGSVGINHGFKDIDSLFDEFHHAVVADEESVYYLIDVKGNKINDVTARRIIVDEGGYELINTDDKYAIANKDGKLVTLFKYEDTDYKSNAEPHNIWTGRNSINSYDVIDVEAGETILENVDVDSFYANYFTVKNSEKKTDYYTYTGKKFYTSNN